MPANPSVPSNVSADSILTLSTYTASALNPKASVVAFATRTSVTGATRLVIPPPLLRWNGTTWVAQYVPRS